MSDNFGQVGGDIGNRRVPRSTSRYIYSVVGRNKIAVGDIDTSTGVAIGSDIQNATATGGAGGSVQITNSLFSSKDVRWYFVIIWIIPATFVLGLLVGLQIGG